jgi:hypothetical protein
VKAEDTTNGGSATGIVKSWCVTHAHSRIPVVMKGGSAAMLSIISKTLGLQTLPHFTCGDGESNCNKT